MSEPLPTSEENLKLKSFKFHGIDTSKHSGKQVITDCAFCGKRKFYINESTGQWDCKACGEQGNTYGFLQAYHELCLSETTDDEYKELEEWRGSCTWEMYQEEGIAWDRRLNRWVFPIRNIDGSVVNLRVRKHEEGANFLSTGGCSNHLWGAAELGEMNGRPGRVYIVEGEFDRMALKWLLRSNNLPGVVVSVPGAATFKEAWVTFFQGKEVVLAYDNDTPGQTGANKVEGLLAGAGCTVHRWNWLDEHPDGYDVDEWIASNRVKKLTKTLAKDLWKQAKTWIRQSEGNKVIAVPDGPPPKLKDLIDKFSSKLYMTPEFSDAIRICMTVAIASKLPGDPLWVMWVARPGYGKTLILQSMQGSSNCVFRSSFHSKDLVSGWAQNGGDDPSLLTKLNGKCFICKDGTEIIEQPAIEQRLIYSTLRGVYDGTLCRSYGNGVTRNYSDLRFAMLMGVTPLIHSKNDALLGERFLRFETGSGNDDDLEHIEAAFRAEMEGGEEDKELATMVTHFLAKTEVDVTKIKYPRWFPPRITRLSQLLAKLRADVPRDDKGDPTHRPKEEVGTRICRQLTKLCVCLTAADSRTEIGEDDYRLAYRVAQDSMLNWEREICGYLFEWKTADRETIATGLGIGTATVSRKLNSMELLNIITSTKKIAASKNGRAGRKQLTYSLTTETRELWDKTIPLQPQTKPKPKPKRTTKQRNKK